MKPASSDNPASSGGGLLFPASGEGWEFWAGTAVAPRTLAADDARVLRHAEWAALPAAAVGNFVMPAPTTEAGALRQAALLRAERLRLKTEHAQPALGWWMAGADSVLVEILDEAKPEAVITPVARHYAASPHLLPLPENGYGFWREHGRLVLAVTSAGAVTYFATFPLPESTAALRQELAALRHQLEFHGLLPQKEVHGFNWEAVAESENGMLAAALPGVWKSAPRPAPRPAGMPAGEIVPVAVAEGRRAESHRLRTRRILLGVAAVYLVGALGWLGVLGQRQIANNVLAQKVAQTADEVAQLQKAARDWGLLEPALDSHYYPLTLLKEVYDMMPVDREIRLDSFSVKDQAIELRGQAANVDQVFRFQRQLDTQPDLHRYQWTLDNPSILPDSGATFRLVGRP